MFTIMAVSVTAIILFCIWTGAWVYERKNRNRMLGVSDDWLFSDFQKSVYKIFYKTEPQDKQCGLNLSEYLRFCRILHKKAEPKKLVALRIEGFLGMMSFLLGAFFYMDQVVGFTLCIILAFAFWYFFGVYPAKHVQSEAEERLFRIKDDLPRFVSLLEKAMDLPIDQAILVTSSRFQSPLSDDLMDCIHRVTLGADGWQQTLFDLAHTYNMEIFSDLVMEIVHSYEQGMNIRHLINRKVYELEQIRLYDVEAHDTKIKSMIFLPVIALKVFPLMVLICLPMLTNF